ncbi:glutamine-hydrolyzing carbamoyl-phosphate synthase small subunit [Paracoccaceae bacterium]|nr:glutamine-hydrolyzing carbamoyl-phosphate synthase small subunit [Paracoccaceae bacterium]
MKKFSGLLLLEDGTTLNGEGYGYEGIGIGELCFNTAMTGYQEIISDPSYAEQIIIFTFPHIGNTGTNKNDNEASVPLAKGIISRTKPTPPSNWRNQLSFNEWLVKNKVTALYGIDTRALTSKIREFGSINAVINFNKNCNHDLEYLKKQLCAWPGIKGRDLTNSNTNGTITSPSLNLKRKKNLAKIAVLNFGTKSNILHCLEKEELEVLTFPSNTTFEDIVYSKPHGILLSNGPGDPLATFKFIERVLKKLITKTFIPIFGICLGHQLLAISLGAKTIKMKHGHHGANHPVLNLKTGKVEITSMNHGFAVESTSLPKNVVESHISLFDGSNCGLEYQKRNIFSVQFHPEASPGPHDSQYLFKIFFDMALKYKTDEKKRL